MKTIPIWRAGEPLRTPNHFNTIVVVKAATMPIAYDELHARISDNFHRADNDPPAYLTGALEHGTWTIDFRDIDPSFLLRRSPHDGMSWNNQKWWTPLSFSHWPEEADRNFRPGHRESLQNWVDLPRNLHAPNQAMDTRAILEACREIY